MLSVNQGFLSLIANANDESGRPSFFAVLKVETSLRRVRNVSLLSLLGTVLRSFFLIVDKAHLLCSFCPIWLCRLVNAAEWRLRQLLFT